MYEAEEVLGLPFPAGGESTPALEPREQALDLPAACVSTELPSICFEMTAAALVGRDEFDVALGLQTFLQNATSPGSVSNQSRRQFSYESSIESSLGENAVESVSSVNMDSERKTIAVCNRHEFRRVPSATAADAGPPFFAGT